ncbi:MAG: insulinase family protein, partial [Candidatus Omnitrophota bacterium]
LMVAFQAPEIKTPDRYGMRIIDNILGASLSGRLFVKIRDELGQAYTTSSWYSPDIDTGNFILYVLTKADKIDSVKAVIMAQLQDLRDHEVSPEELGTAKIYLKGALRRSLMTNSALGGRVALDELYGLGYNAYQQFFGRIDAVTAPDVRRIAQKYLDISKAAVVITKPKVNK